MPSARRSPPLAAHPCGRAIGRAGSHRLVRSVAADPGDGLRIGGGGYCHCRVCQAKGGQSGLGGNPRQTRTRPSRPWPWPSSRSRRTRPWPRGRPRRWRLVRVDGGRCRCQDRDHTAGEASGKVASRPASAAARSTHLAPRPSGGLFGEFLWHCAAPSLPAPPSASRCGGASRRAEPYDAPVSHAEVALFSGHAEVGHSNFAYKTVCTGLSGHV